MSVPPTTDDAPPTDATPAAKGRMRPPGEQGGHTVQDWEQPTPKPFVKGDSSSRSTPPPPEQTEGQATALGDEPSPVVEPIYLRSVPAAPLAKADAPVQGKSEHSSLAGTETLVDVITSTVSGLLQQSLRESVLAAVRALAPRMIITFPAPIEEPREATASSSRPPPASRAARVLIAAEPGRIAERGPIEAEPSAPASGDATDASVPAGQPPGPESIGALPEASKTTRKSIGANES